MKLFSNLWFVAAIALVINLTISSALLFRHVSAMVQAPEIEHAPAPREANFEYWNFHTGEIEALIADLKDEKEQLDFREGEIATMQARLEAERAEIERLREEVASERKRLSTFITEIATAEEENLKTLATTYAALSPEAAVSVFDELEDEFVVKLLYLMKPDLVASLFEQMTGGRRGASQADRVARLSRMLRLLKAQENATANNT